MRLKTQGFEALVTAAAQQARGCGLAADAVRIAVTLDGKVPEQVGREAMNLSERVCVELAESCAAGFDATASDGDLLMLSESGRLRVFPDEIEPPEQGHHLLGAVKWPSRPASVARLWELTENIERRQFEEIRRWLTGHSAEQVRHRVQTIGHALIHMAPVLFYVGDRVYSNLGRFTNLPGRSLPVGAPGSVLTGLAESAAAQWSPEDATFVVCLHALINSGTPVRAEEFNGLQLDPDAVVAFLEERVQAYGAQIPGLPDGGIGARLDQLAEVCARARTGLLREGATFYRVINGINLHKREQIMTEPIGWGALPPLLVKFLEEVAGRSFPADSPPEAVEEFVTQTIRGLPPHVPAGFTTPYEGFLHRFFETAATALNCDVAMGRGPRRVIDLGSEVPVAQRVDLATRDFYCCVVPTAAFAERFGADREALARTLSAYSARMRYNTWHYLPHSMSWPEEESGRDDWFFAPVMPDMTRWSDQHHTGHVTFGVRHALRIPLGIVLGGRFRPGLYDLRLMRTSGGEFGLADLRAAIAAGRIQAMAHQAAADLRLEIEDFDNTWYREFHGA
ncbi:hypothetical protein ACIP5Y_31690 [Nocardia sp. NPDC088792]|uniref:hypothetical protein n=1 Tax=Nocardia sp. NPDC088792 TaxID=3364332 RepID=UPI00380F705B